MMVKRVAAEARQKSLPGFVDEILGQELLQPVWQRNCRVRMGEQRCPPGQERLSMRDDQQQRHQR